MSAKHFLLLQGVATPFFSELGKTIQHNGHRVLRVNFCGGDALFSGNLTSIDYTATLSDLPQWITQLVAEHKITDAVLFGDTRPIHQAILPCLKATGVDLHVYEEGYFRPDWVTLETEGVNGYSRFIHTPPETWLERSQQLPERLKPRKVGANFKYRAIYDFSYRLANGLLAFKYRHYQNHRPHNGVREYLGWAWRFSANTLWRSRQDQLRINQLIKQNTRFFLLPLQLESDAQIHTHSPFANIREVIEQVIESFANQAPAECYLLIKNHPLSTGLPNHGKTIQRLAKRYQVESRIIYIETGDLSPLLKHTQGTLLVNSTTATHALQLGSPVIALGTALFNLPGLTHQGDLSSFWTGAQPPDPELLRAYRQVLLHATQINGDFYSPQGIAMTVDGSLARLGALPVTTQTRIETTLLITGASKGIGAALARHYAQPGVRLGLIARDAQRLQQVADICQQRGAEVITAALDVTDQAALADWITQFDQQHPIDLLITNAGVTLAANPDGSLESLTDSHELLQINLAGTLNAVHPVVEQMRQRGKGQVAMVSSLAAYYGMPITPIYCASKAAIKSYGEALRGLLGPQGVQVNIICPGFVETDLSDRFPGKRPCLLSPEQAASCIAKGLAKNRAIIAFPRLLALGMKCLQWMPFPVASFFMGLSGYNRAQKVKPK